MTFTRKKLLFTGGGGAGSEALSRLLGESYEVHFADADLEAKPYAIEPQCFHCIPMAAAPTFIDELGSLCRRLGIDLLIPGVDEELLPIALRRAEFACEVLLPEAQFVRTHLDKLQSSTALEDAGVPTPRTQPASSRQEIDFPCILKPRTGRGSRGVSIVHSEVELAAQLAIANKPADTFILQELLGGQEYTVMMSADRYGTLRAIVPVKVGVKRGITLRAQTDPDPEVIAACALIHERLPARGCYNIQLMKSADGIARPFEINPRISTTACLGLAAGVNFIDVYLDAAAGARRRELLPFKGGVGLKRSWYNEFVL